jgi:hypothetical protein
MPEVPARGLTTRFTSRQHRPLVSNHSRVSVRTLTLRALPVTLRRARYDAARSLATSNLKKRAALSPRIFARESSLTPLIVRSIASAECGQVPS